MERSKKAVKFDDILENNSPNIKKYVKRKNSKTLPDNFFENVLDLELRLKREFTMESLQEIVNLYSVNTFELNLDGN